MLVAGLWRDIIAAVRLREGAAGRPRRRVPRPLDDAAAPSPSLVPGRALHGILLEAVLERAVGPGADGRIGPIGSCAADGRPPPVAGGSVPARGAPARTGQLLPCRRR